MLTLIDKGPTVAVDRSFSHNAHVVRMIRNNESRIAFFRGLRHVGIIGKVVTSK